MVKKYCPRCKRFSYSAATEGKWICPTCGNDLTQKPEMLLDEFDISQVRKKGPLLTLIPERS